MKKRKGGKANKGRPATKSKRPVASSGKSQAPDVKRVVRRTKGMTIVELVPGRQPSQTSLGSRQTSRKPASTAPAQAVLAPTILTVRNEDLARLGAGEAVDFLRELLWAEARRI